MSYEPETPMDKTDLSEKTATSYDPRGPIEVTTASGADDNSGTIPPPEQQFGDGDEGSAPTTGK